MRPMLMNKIKVT